MNVLLKELKSSYIWCLVLICSFHPMTGMNPRQSEHQVLYNWNTNAVHFSKVYLHCNLEFTPWAILTSMRNSNVVAWNRFTLELCWEATHTPWPEHTIHCTDRLASKPTWNVFWNNMIKTIRDNYLFISWSKNVCLIKIEIFSKQK